MPPAARNKALLITAGFSLPAGLAILAAGSGLPSAIYYDQNGYLYLLLLLAAAHQVTAAILTALTPRPPRSWRQRPRHRITKRGPLQTQTSRHSRSNPPLPAIHHPPVTRPNHSVDL